MHRLIFLKGINAILSKTKHGSGESRSWRAILRQRLDLEQAYSFLKDASVTRGNRANEIPDFPLTGITVISTKANVDGKYKIADLAPGNYYIYASFISSSIGVDWLIPVRITAGDETTVDLNNANAATVRNN
jgi:hypothetical protein